MFHFYRDILHNKGFSNALKGSLRYLFGKRGKRLVSGLRLFYRLRVFMLLRTGEAIGKLSRGNEVRVWIDGRQSFRRIVRLIGRAKYSIVVQMFIWKDDDTGRRMASTLLAAARRGVNVDINKEAVGDLFELNGDFFGTKKSADPMWKEFWSHPRIRITVATNNDHAKVYVIDDQILLLTGMNIADEYRYKWHDFLIELRGSAYVAQFLTHEKSQTNSEQVELVMNTSERKDIRPVLHTLLDSARESVVVEHCYMSDSEVNDKLIALSKRDVRVTVIIPEYNHLHYHSNMNTIGRLISEGKSANLNVLLYPNTFHAKIILVDYKTAFVGSANLMKNSLNEMGEVNVLIRGKQRAIHTLREALRQDALKSRALSSPPSFLWASRWLAWLGL
jgi:cardiolipin synthase